jgi:ribosomal protein L25 (general stress protein Ctc)
VPANLYGKKGEGVTLWLPATDALHLHQEGLTEVTLEVGGKAEPARVQEIQVDPLHDVVLHVDFVRV